MVTGVVGAGGEGVSVAKPAGLTFAVASEPTAGLWVSQIIVKATARPSSAQKAAAIQRGRNPRCTYLPSTLSGVAPDRDTSSVYGRCWLEPNQIICRGLSVAFTNTARPGSIWTLAGWMSYASWSPLSVPLIEAVSLVLPMLSTASLGLPRKRPFTVGGTISARTSVNGVMVRLPSGTVVASGLSVGTTRIAYGFGPAVASGVRGGVKVSRIESVVPG